MVDSNTIYALSGKFIIGILLFVRISGMFISGPFFSHSSIIPQMKAIFCIILAMSMTEVYWQNQPQVDFHLWNIVFLVLKELFVGLTIGFAANAVFWAARFAGGMLDFDMGYQTAMLFNSDETSPTLIGELFDVTVLMIFLIINGHHFLLQSIHASLRAVPLTNFAVTESTVQLLIRLCTSVMIIGIKMSAPVLVSLFLTNLALSLLARIAPQTNIFMMSFQAKIAVGILVMLVSVPLFVFVAKYSLQAAEGEMLDILLSLNPVKV